MWDDVKKFGLGATLIGDNLRELQHFFSRQQPFSFERIQLFFFEKGFFFLRTVERTASWIQALLITSKLSERVKAIKRNLYVKKLFLQVIIGVRWYYNEQREKNYNNNNKRLGKNHIIYFICSPASTKGKWEREKETQKSNGRKMRAHI